MDITTIYGTAIIIGLGILVGGAIIIMRTSISSLQWRAATAYTEQLIRAGHQLYTSGALQKTALYARAAKELKARYPHLTEDQIETLIESALADFKLLIQANTQP